MSANGIEIERKWLVSGLPEGYTPRKHRIVESFYLFANDDAELSYQPPRQSGERHEWPYLWYAQV